MSSDLPHEGGDPNKPQEDVTPGHFEERDREEGQPDLAAPPPDFGLELDQQVPDQTLWGPPPQGQPFVADAEVKGNPGHRRVVTYSVVAVLLLLVAVVAFGLQSQQQSEPVLVEQPVAEATIPGVKVFENQGVDHVTEPLPESRLPPTGGDHFGVLQNCRAYSVPIDNGNAVHSLEHGVVWLTYDPDLPKEQIELFNGFTEGQTHVLVSPYPGQRSPVVATAWGRQLELSQAQDPRLALFVQEYLGGAQAPEPDAPCSGGAGEII